MRRIIFTIIFLGFSFIGFGQSQPNIAFENGNWFTGEGFEVETFYSVNGKLTQNKPSHIDTTINLTDKFIILPLGDAHTHNLDERGFMNETIKKYLNEGTFYVQVLTNHASAADALRKRFEQATNLDVKYANGGLTSSGGHPFATYEAQALGLSWRAMIDSPEKIRGSRIEAGDAYWILDEPRDVHAKWKDILASKPDLIKIYLINANKFKELSANGKLGDKGLSPEVAELVVNKAHEAGLEVYAHIETADDFRLGLKIGVDGFAHMPGYSWKGKGSPDAYRLSDEDINQAAKQDVIVIPTANFARIYATKYHADGTRFIDSTQKKTVNQFLSKELRRFKEQGVRLAIGSDQTGSTVSVELDYFKNELNVFDNLYLLQLATIKTPQSIFPNREIGELKEGYEASFLVLEQNPIKNFDALKQISLRVKEGFIFD